MSLRVSFDEKFYELIEAFLAKEKENPKSVVFADKDGILAYFARNYKKISKQNIVAERLKLKLDVVTAYIEQITKAFEKSLPEGGFLDSAAWQAFFTSKRKMAPLADDAADAHFRYMFHGEKSPDGPQWQMWPEWAKALDEAGFDFKSQRMEDIRSDLEGLGKKAA